MHVDAVVHAALVTLFTWLVNQIFVYLGIDLGGEVASNLATVIVGYILSLFGLALWRRSLMSTNIRTTPEDGYRPPFT